MVVANHDYQLAITNRTPSFSGKASDPYRGSEKTNSNGSIDTFAKVASGPDKMTLTIKSKDGESAASITATYLDYLTKEYTLTDLKDEVEMEKSTRFYLTTPFPLIDGYYQVILSLQDQGGNSYDYPVFYLSLNYAPLTQTVNKPLVQHGH
jgi:hypothetical protein